MKKSDNEGTDNAKSDSGGASANAEGSYYYDDATGYEVFTDDDEEQDDSERAKKDLPA